MAEEDQPDPNLPLKGDRIQLDLDELTAAEAVALIQREAAKLLDPRIEIDTEYRDPVFLLGQRHMTRKEFNWDEEQKGRRRHMQELNDRDNFLRLAAAHPDWLVEPPQPGSVRPPKPEER